MLEQLTDVEGRYSPAIRSRIRKIIVEERQRKNNEREAAKRRARAQQRRKLPSILTPVGGGKMFGGRKIKHNTKIEKTRRVRRPQKMSNSLLLMRYLSSEDSVKLQVCLPSHARPARIARASHPPTYKRQRQTPLHRAVTCITCIRPARARCIRRARTPCDPAPSAPTHRDAPPRPALAVPRPTPPCPPLRSDRPRRLSGRRRVRTTTRCSSRTTRSSLSKRRASRRTGRTSPPCRRALVSERACARTRSLSRSHARNPERT